MLPLIRPNPTPNNDRSILTAQSWFRIRRFPSGPKNINTMVERQRDMDSSKTLCYKVDRYKRYCANKKPLRLLLGILLESAATESEKISPTGRSRLTTSTKGNIVISSSNRQTQNSVYTWNNSQQTQAITADSQRSPSEVNRETFSRSPHTVTITKTENEKSVHINMQNKGLSNKFHSLNHTTNNIVLPRNGPILPHNGPILPCNGPIFPRNGPVGYSPMKSSETAATWQSNVCTSKPFDATSSQPLNLQKAFKPIEPRPYNNPLAVDVTRPSGHGIAPALPSNGLSNLHNPGGPLKELCPNKMTHLTTNPSPVAPLSPLLVTPNFSGKSQTLEPSLLTPNSTCIASPAYSPNVSAHSSSVLTYKRAILPIPPQSTKISASSLNTPPLNPLASSGVSPNSINESEPDPSRGKQRDDPHNCCCNRSPTSILCKSCGEIFQGRKRQKCKVHPNQIFLMDIRCCPTCQSDNLKEIYMKQ
ncbi:hypothetical protein PoB_001044900 [Plakobranchus ocellatus]|uniref:Uncharacterized protein n=1 Tax=Plakobranchus ocellatus TaxID=259542 RepID=A0AAV3YP88_9GAST|nr:hypothetical protein PoB_001044900 [Plakobranchus ocellatus]